MVRIELELDDSVHAALRSVVARCNAAHKSSGGANTHGELNVKKLLTLLAEDAAMMQSRPGSWEAFDNVAGARRARLSVLQRVVRCRPKRGGRRRAGTFAGRTDNTRSRGVDNLRFRDCARCCVFAGRLEHRMPHLI
ncbi:hypothetical protein AWB75_06270 [Caballeronia catudaia]|uniref:Uncharacterized protein n=1 Tax=Caballeronia catudaia TaxID=1777136 RepID=A0A158D714_9BURK|nr:hypothetical protein AWB75_06270 [Caballeronia catudaia]